VRADSGFDVALARAEWDYRVLAPVLANGIAVIGDPALYACAGDARVARITSDEETVVVTVLGARECVRVLGWARHPVVARSWSPADGSRALEIANDPETGSWELEITTADAGWTKVYVGRTT
jgi:hypothetical protein